MNKDSLKRYLLDTFEKEKRALFEKKEEEEKKLDSFYLSEKKRLEEEYKKKEEDLKKELKKRLEKEYLEKEIELQKNFEEILIERISEIQKKIIMSLRDEDYENTFEKLVSELPDLELEKVIVNPKDKKLAEKFFVGLKILEDKDITGGFIAFTKDELIKIDNTFEKRVEKVKEVVLTRILKEVRDYLEKDYVEKNI